MELLGYICSRVLIHHDATDLQAITPAGGTAAAATVATVATTAHASQQSLYTVMAAEAEAKCLPFKHGGVNHDVDVLLLTCRHVPTGSLLYSAARVTDLACWQVPPATTKMTTRLNWARHQTDK